MILGFIWLDAWFPLVPGETLVITGGVLAAQGELVVWLVALAGFIGAALEPGCVLFLAFGDVHSVQTLHPPVPARALIPVQLLVELSGQPSSRPDALRVRSDVAVLEHAVEGPAMTDEHELERRLLDLDALSGPSLGDGLGLLDGELHGFGLIRTLGSETQHVRHWAS